MWTQSCLPKTLQWQLHVAPCTYIRESAVRGSLRPRESAARGSLHLRESAVRGLLRLRESAVRGSLHLQYMSQMHVAPRTYVSQL